MALLLLLLLVSLFDSSSNRDAISVGLFFVVYEAAKQALTARKLKVEQAAALADYAACLHDLKEHDEAAAARARAEDEVGGRKVGWGSRHCP